MEAIKHEPRHTDWSTIPIEHLDEGVERQMVVGEKLMICRLRFAPNIVTPAHDHPHEQVTLVERVSNVADDRHDFDLFIYEDTPVVPQLFIEIADRAFAERAYSCDMATADTLILREYQKCFDNLIPFIENECERPGAILS